MKGRDKNRFQASVTKFLRNVTQVPQKNKNNVRTKMKYKIKFPPFPNTFYIISPTQETKSLYNIFHTKMSYEESVM